MRSLYFISVAFSCIMLFTLAHATTSQPTTVLSKVITSTSRSTTKPSTSTNQPSPSTSTTKLSISATKPSTSPTGHPTQATTPFCDCSIYLSTTMQSSVAGKQSTTTTQTKQSITSTVQSSANLTSSLSNTMKPSSSPITVTSTSADSSTSTSQTSPTTNQSTSTSQTSQSTSTSQTSPATSQSTSASQTSPATSPTTAASTSQTSPTTAPLTNPTSAASTSPTTAASTSPTTAASTSPTTASPTTASPTTASPTTTINPITTTSSMTSVARLRRDTRFSNGEQNDIMNSTENSDCFRVCHNITDSTPNSTTETTTISTTSPTETTTFVPRYSPADLSNTTVEVTLVVIVNGSFTDVPNNRSSQNYTAFADKFKASLTEFYKDILGNRFKGIIINGFSEGSIMCNYTVELKAPTNKSEAKAVLDDMTNATWSSLNVTGIPGPVLVVETQNAQKKDLEDVDDLLHVYGGNTVCGKQAVLRFGQNNNGTAICVYKCDINTTKPDCGSHGECVVTYEGEVNCLCKDDNNNVYHGDSCKKTVPAHGPTTVKTVVVTESLSRTDIIAIAAGTGGGLVLLLLISLICVCRKLQSSKKRNKFYSYMGNDKEALHSENSRIENVPNIKNDHTNMAYVRDTDYMQLQRFEPEGKNVNHETGQRQGYERDEKSYRKVEAPDVGNVTIYQPSHLKEPIDRQSGASKFDREEVQSYPFHTMDTEKSYKIRRPTVNSDTSTPYN